MQVFAFDTTSLSSDTDAPSGTYRKQQAILQGSLAAAKKIVSFEGDSNTTRLNKAMLSASAAFAAAQLAKKHSKGNKVRHQQL